jgi:hypothetical protein
VIFINMVTLALTRLASGMPYIAISALEAALKLAYEQGEADNFITEFNAMMFVSTVAVVNDETTIYPQDVAAIFGLLKIHVNSHTTYEFTGHM